jgi:fluoride exporter
VTPGALPLGLAALAVAAGGAAGSLARWGVGLALNRPGAAVPWGTLAVNALGGLLIGLALAWLSRQPSELGRLLWVTGVLGGFTTFSAFSAESLMLLLRGQWPLALAHTAAHVGLGLGGAALGWWLARGVL